MSEATPGRLPPALVETVAGLSAGCMATLIVHPLDIVKTRMQIHRSTVGHASPLTTVALMRSLVQTQHPIASLYRGLTPNIIGNASSWASFFFFKSRAERFIAHLKSSESHHATEDATTPRSLAPLTPADYFVSSGLAGVGVQILTNPIWVLKTRMISSDRSAAGAYPSTAAGAVRLWRDEGYRGFYRGLGISLFGVTHGAVQFAVYEPVKKMYFARRRDAAAPPSAGAATTGTGSATAPAQDGGHMTNEATLVISTLSKLIAGATTYPYQVVRSRLQNYDAEQRFGRGISGVVRRLWAEEGLRGFYRGLVPGVIRVMPATWVTFLVYENVKYYLPRWLD